MFTHTIHLTLLLILPLMIIATSLEAQNTSEEKLSARQISIVKIASYTALGDLSELENELAAGLENGLTINEIKEVLVHTYAYCGFPRSIRGLQTFLQVLKQRDEQGIEDEWGRAAAPIEDSRSKYDRGVEILEELVLAKMEGPKPDYQQFSPEIDTFLKEHLFADIFERDVLSYLERELATISVIASLGNLDPMLRGHLNISLNVGLTPVQLTEFIEVIKSTAGRKEAKYAVAVLNEVTKNR